jgi:Na+-transporting methylmalonyl-CoA/oxaloacetate decarboxylase gamma subunit
MIVNEVFLDFSAIDGLVVTIALVGMSVVFVVLAVLYFVYLMIPKIINISARRRLKKAGRIIDESKNLHIDSDVNAAISLALYMYLNEIHDEESSIITIKQEQRSYTPWSSKIYSTNAYHRFPQR